MCLIPLLLAALKRRGSLTTREGEKDESDPPQTGGDLRPKVDACCGMPLLWPQGVALVLIYPCGKAQKQPPFPSRFIVSDRSSPSRVRFAASRPGRLRADPKDALLTRGKGGAGRGARSGESSRMVEESSGSLAHDKGYYHSYCRGGTARSAGWGDCQAHTAPRWISCTNFSNSPPDALIASSIRLIGANSRMRC